MVIKPTLYYSVYCATRPLLTPCHCLLDVLISHAHSFQFAAVRCLQMTVQCCFHLMHFQQRFCRHILFIHSISTLVKMSVGKYRHLWVTTGRCLLLIVPMPYNRACTTFLDIHFKYRLAVNYTATLTHHFYTSTGLCSYSSVSTRHYLGSARLFTAFKVPSLELHALSFHKKKIKKTQASKQFMIATLE